MSKPLAKKRLTQAQDFEATVFDTDVITRVAKRYGVAVTDHVLTTITGTPQSDPVAKQYIPQLQELKILPEESPDPIGDDAHSPLKGLVHRYPDRVLLKAANVCAVYCRYCFRREMIGPGTDSLSAQECDAALDYIESRPAVWEVILTGGDPLVLSSRKLSHIITRLNAIPHVQVIRIHSRVPIADPQRVTQEILDILGASEKALYVALHINHANEITPEVRNACASLHKAGCVLVSQSVLLKGVNDSAQTLEDLFRALVAMRVKPYYLHHADLAPGTSHFRTSIAAGQALMKDLQGRLSGLCLPHYMLDIPGGHGKIPVGPGFLETQDDGSYIVEDVNGNRHVYPPKPGTAQ